MSHDHEHDREVSQCKWEWLGDVWSKLQDCTNLPAESCGEPPYQGSMIGEIAFTGCSS
jgi:hypothetical protein